MHTYGIYKNGIEEPTCRVRIEMQTQRTDMWAWGWGDDGTN